MLKVRLRSSYNLIFSLFLILALAGASPLWASSKKKTDLESSTESSVSSESFPSIFPEYESHLELINSWCQSVNREIAALKWKLDPCKNLKWQIGGLSVQGHPLVYAVFGNPKATNTSLVFTAVHGDEITPFYLGIRLATWLQENQESLRDIRVVLAPLVNPDGFFVKPRTRVNARGVDVNRNFDTKDWRSRALVAWKKRFRSDPRRNPGKTPSSEPETLFQEELIHRVKPQKILSIHAPLNFLDYDGPSAMSLVRFPKEYVQECLKLRSKLKAISGGFFPGSLGNFAGQELGIPTLTLELPSADPAKAESYWKLFNQGIQVMMEYVVPPVSLTVQSS